MSLSTCVAPISGKYLVNQIALYIVLKDCGYIPDIILCSSGGAISSALSCATDFTLSADQFKEKLFSLTDKLEAKYFIKSWLPWPLDKLPAVIPGLFNTSIYNKGEDFPSELIDIDFNKQPEMWIGTYSVNTGNLTIWRTREKTQFDFRCKFLKQYEGVKYIKEDFKNVIRATAAIPCVVPPIEIDGGKYLDGGTLFASPLNIILDMYTQEEKVLPYKVVYVSCINRFKQTPDIANSRNIIDVLRGTVGELTTGLNLYDISLGIEMVGNQNIKYEKGEDYNFLIEALSKANKVNRSFILLMPKEEHMLSLYDFNPGDITNLVKKSLQSGFIIEHWYN